MSDKLNEKMNEKVIDDLIESAAELYAEHIAEEDSPGTLTPEQERHCEDSREEIRRNVLHRLKKANAKSTGRRRRAIRRSLTCAAAVVVLVAVMANVSAVRVFVYKTYTNMKGSVLSLQTDSMQQYYEQIEQFENKDEFIIPSWLPPGTVLDGVTDSARKVTLSYINETERFNLKISEQDLSNETISSFETENNAVAVEECEVMGMPGKILQMQSEVDTNRRTVVWSSDTTYYELSTNADDMLFETIMSSLKYYKDN